VRDVAGEAGQDPVLDALWERVTEAWGDEQAHAALIEHATRTGALHLAAARYRALTADPDRAELARKKLDVIVLAATHVLLSTKTPAHGKVPLAITLSAFAVSAILLGWLALAVWGGR